MRGLGVHRHALALLGAGLLAGLLAVALRGSPPMRGLEQRSIEARFSIRGDRAPSPRVVVVALDAESLRHLDRPPVARRFDAELVDNLRRAGASVVAFDFTLEQPSSDRAGDLAIIRALDRTRAAVVSVATVRRGARTELLAGRMPFDATRVRPGSTSLRRDSDGAIRRFPVALGGVPSLPAVAAALYHGRAHAESAPESALIDFAGTATTVPALPFIDVLDGKFESRLVRGKVVVIGPTAPALQDLHETAVGGAPMSGPEIHANAIATALADYPLRAMGSNAGAALLLALGGLVPLLLSRRVLRGRVGTWSVVAAGAAALGAWTAGAQWSFASGIVVDYSAGVLAILGTCAGAGGMVSLLGRRERRELRALFASHSPDVVRRVLDQSMDEPAGLARTEVIAGYTIEAVIGRGGMGVVYRASQRHPSRAVALKLILPDHALQEDFRARFERESRIVSSLGHPNVIPVYDAGNDDGLLFIAMLLVEGLDLARMLKSTGPMDLRTVATVVGQVAGALDAAHAGRLVHRDVKPANILVTTGRPLHAYLTDFGVARHVDGSDAVTRPGGLVGTIDYLAPEIIDRRPASAASDVYALAAVLYECVTGAVAFDRPSVAAKLVAHAQAPPPSASAGRRGCPVALDAVVARGLAKDPDDRYPTATALADAASEALGFARWTDQAAQATTSPPEDPEAATRLPA